MEQIIDNMDNTPETAFFYGDGVDRSYKGYIKQTFETLLLSNNLKQQHLADKLGINKAYMSRIINCLQDPPRLMKMKIAKALGVDSRVIWV